MSRRVGLRLVPDRVVDDPLDERERLDEARQDPTPQAKPDDQEPGDQPPALGATPAATPSR
jgi:hypothetical protein